MKKKHPFLYNIIRRSIVVVLLAMMALTAYNQSTGSLISPEGLLAKIITPIQGFVSQASQAISNYMYRVKLRSNIEYEYNQLKAQNDELTAVFYTKNWNRKIRSCVRCLANMSRARP